MSSFMAVFKQLMHEMFKRVGLAYTEGYCQQVDWYKNKSWTREEQQNFQRWGEGVLKSKLKLTDYGAAREMSWFILSYGWITRLDDEDKN